MVEVVAALIWREERFLICQRPANKARALLWEFVGGKAEAGETLKEALIRECREELDITVAVDDIFLDVVHEYPDIHVHLTLFNSRIAEGEPKLLEHHDMKWITVNEIDQYDFCPADVEILAKLKAEHMAKRWLQAFASDVSQKDLEKYVCSDHNYLWHIFSWNLVPCLSGEDARKAFDAMNYSKALRFSSGYYFDGVHIEEIEACSKCNSADLEAKNDVYIVSEDFRWTYVNTHEHELCGPYFLKK